MIKQRTIKSRVVIEGTGLQTGKKSTLILKSAPINSGINFIRTDLPNKPLLNIQSLDLGNPNKDLERRTTLGMGPIQIQTTEHLLAAFAGLSIDNIIAELDDVELPGLDGSAGGFVEALMKAGIEEQPAAKKFLELTEPVWCGDGGSFLAAFPGDDFKISYTMSYKDASLGTQFLSLSVNEKNFKEEIAPARTFCLEAEAAELLRRGLGKGANYENTLVMGKEGPIKNSLRFADEPVRHKILDLIGDISLVGMSVKCSLVAIKSGHKLNMELAKKLKEKIGL